MKKLPRLVRIFPLVGLLFAWAAAAHAQSEGATGVPTRIWASASGRVGGVDPSEIELTGDGFLAVDPVSGGGTSLYVYGVRTGSSWYDTDRATVQMEAGKVYYLAVTGLFNSQNALNVVPPVGYQVEIDGTVRNRLASSGNSHTYVVRLIAPQDTQPMMPGTGTPLPPPTSGGNPAPEPVPTGAAPASLTANRIYWQAALGALQNGESARSLALVDAGNAASWSPLFTPAALQYTAPSPEVVVYREGNAIRQILAHATAADVVTLSPTAYEIRFYHPAQAVGTVFPVTFTGAPFVTYRIEQGGTDTTLRITSETRDLATQVIARTAVTTLTRTGTWPNYTWNLQDWNTSGQAQQVQEVRQSGGTTQNRTETVTLSQPGGAVATQMTRNYTLQAWGEVLGSETRGTANSLTTTYDYYTDATQPGSYTFLKSIVQPGGGWEAYGYWGSATDGSDTGRLRYRYRPYGGNPATVSFDATQGEVTSYAYSLDPYGMATRPALVETRINDVVTARSVITYALLPTVVNGQPLVESTRLDSTDAANTLTTRTRYYAENAPDLFLRNQIQAVTGPDGVKTAYAYQRGTYDEATRTFAVSPTGPASRIAVILGSVNSSAGNLLSSHDGYDLDDLYLVDGKSTQVATIRDDRALIRRTENYAWKNGGWNLVGATDFTYDAAGFLTAQTEDDGAQMTAVYVGEQQTSRTDEAGLTVSYTYDSAGRIQTAAKSAGPTLSYAYDAGNRVVSETMSAAGTGETLRATRHYDDAGRLDAETPAGLGSTTYSYYYYVAGRSRTANYPDGGTRTEHYRLDGRLESVDGSATVPQFYSYGLDASAFRTIQVYSGYSGSPRWQKTTIDWLGRSAEVRRPGFAITGQADYVEQNTYEPGTGRLSKTTRSGLAPAKYEYDALSNVVRTGLDIGDDGLVNASVDRITETDQYFESDGTGWWLRQDTRIYPKANDPTVVTASSQRTRLSGHPAGRLEEIRLTDIDGNVVTRTVEVNRGTATATITTTRPGVSNPQVETLVNGLATAVTGHDGLTTSTDYDSFERPWRTRDPRGNATTLGYQSGSALVATLTDGAGNSVGTFAYDGLGRRQWVRDAAGQYTRFAYNPRGQLTQQWGGGSHPVAHGYDATYGDRTTLSTYRAAGAADSATWPAVGAADPTTWTNDSATGLVWKKTDAAGQSVEFDYNPRGQTTVRRWARGLVSNPAVKLACSYTYDGNTGELLGAAYNDGADPIPTPALGYSYTRLGQLAGATDSTGGRSFAYSAAAPWRLDSETLPAGFYASRVLSRRYNTTTGVGGNYGPHTPGFITGRYQGFELGVAGDPARDYHQNYTWSNLGRFVGVNTRTTTGAARDYVYNHQSGSALLSGYVMGSLTLSRGYETQRDLPTSVEAKWGANAALVRFDYTYNALAQRRTAKQSGSAFADYWTGQAYSAVYNAYTYNARGELQTAAMYRGDTPSATPAPADELPGRRFEYRYDSIGNRQTAGAAGAANTADDEYTTNALNQYATKENNTVKVLGTAAASARVAVAAAPSTGKTDRAWGAEFVPANTGGSVQGTATVHAALPGAGPGGADLVRTDGRSYFAPPDLQSFAYDADGNLVADGVWTYTYNAENQLVRMQSALPGGFGFTRRRVDYQYDYLGRRVAQTVLDLDSNTQTLARRYLYDGWNVVAETDPAGVLQRTFTWGLDLAGSLTATGGVGALLQIHDLAAGKTLAAAADGNGNIAALLNADTGALEAAYEYDPFGNLLRREGPYAQSNPLRFSSKWQDDETGLVYYGLRYFAPGLGRFINRDPIEESGGVNLYGFVGNDGVNGWDYLGLNHNTINGAGLYGFYTYGGSLYQVRPGPSGPTGYLVNEFGIATPAGGFDYVPGTAGFLSRGAITNTRIKTEQELDRERPERQPPLPSNTGGYPVQFNDGRTARLVNGQFIFDAPNNANTSDEIISSDTANGIDVAGNMVGAAAAITTGEAAQVAARQAAQGGARPSFRGVNVATMRNMARIGTANAAQLARIGRTISAIGVAGNVVLAGIDVYQSGGSNRSFARTGVSAAVTFIGFAGGPIGAGVALGFSILNTAGAFDGFYNYFDNRSIRSRVDGPPGG